MIKMLVCIVNNLGEKPKAEGTFNGMYVDANRVQMNYDVMNYLSCDVFTKDNVQISISKAIVDREEYVLIIKGYVNQVRQL